MTKIINKRDAIALFWNNSNTHIGTAFNEILIPELFGMQTGHTRSDTSEMIGAGSALGEALTTAGQTPMIVWGSGLIQDYQELQITRTPAVFALRGKTTKAILEQHCSKKIACVLGDPGILAPFLPEFSNTDEIRKEYDIGIIPHYLDADSRILPELKQKYEQEHLRVNVIDILADSKTVIREIRKCRCILSSALYGLIFSDAFGIPNAWCKLTDKIAGDGFQFYDYYSAYDLTIYPMDLRVRAAPEISDIIRRYWVKPEMVSAKQKALIQAFPYECPGKTALLEKLGIHPLEAQEKKRYSVISFITNGYENVKEIEEKDKDAAYLMVSDTILSSDSWDVLCDLSLKDYEAPFDRCLHVRYHLFDYCSTDICICLDGSIQVKHSLKCLVDRLEKENYDAAFLPHPLHHNFMDEYDAWVKYRGYRREHADQCLDYFRKQGYPLAYKGLIQINFFIIRNSEEIRNLFRSVWDILHELGENGHMERIDQIPFSYVLNTAHANLNILPLSEQVLRSYYLQLYEHGDQGNLNLNSFYDLEKPDLRYLFNKEVRCLYLETPTNQWQSREKEWEQRWKKEHQKAHAFQTYAKEQEALALERLGLCKDYLQQYQECLRVSEERLRLYQFYLQICNDRLELIQSYQKRVEELSQKPFNRICSFVLKKLRSH